MTPRLIEEYALYVDRRGNEVTIGELPAGHAQKLSGMGGHSIPVNHVRLLELEDGSLIEETTIPVISSPFADKRPLPDGADWEMHKLHSDRSIYRRPKPEEQRPHFANFEDWMLNGRR